MSDSSTEVSNEIPKKVVNVGVNGSDFVGPQFTKRFVTSRLEAVAKEYGNVTFHILDRPGVSRYCKEFILEHLPSCRVSLYSTVATSLYKTYSPGLTLVLHLSQREAIEAWESSFAYADSIFALLTLEQAVDKVKDPISIDGSNRIVISAPDGFAANVGAQIEMMIDNSEWQDADKKIEPKQARVTTPEPLPRGSRELRFELKRALKREKKETTHKSRLSRAMAKYKNRLSPATMEPKRLANFLSPASPVNGGAEAIMIPDDDVGTATADGLEDNREDIPSGRAPTSLEEVFSKEKKNEFDSSSSLSLDGMDTKEQPLEQKLPKSFQPDDDLLVNEFDDNSNEDDCVDEQGYGDDDSFIASDSDDVEYNSSSEESESSAKESEESAEKDKNKKRKVKGKRTSAKTSRSKKTSAVKKRKSKPSAPKKAKKEFVAAPDEKTLKDRVVKRRTAAVAATVARNEFVKDDWIVGQNGTLKQCLSDKAIDLGATFRTGCKTNDSSLLEEMCKRPLEEWPSTKYFQKHFGIIRALWTRIGPARKSALMQELFHLASVGALDMFRTLTDLNGFDKHCITCDKTEITEGYKLDHLPIAEAGDPQVTLKFPITLGNSFDDFYVATTCATRVRSLLDVHDLYVALRISMLAGEEVDFQEAERVLQWYIAIAQEKCAHKTRHKSILL